MGRPKKDIVDYFPHLVNHTQTMEIIDLKYGNDGKAVWWLLLETLGSTSGHAIYKNNVMKWELLVSKSHVSEEKLIEILDTLSRLGAIDLKLLENGIIWCQNFVDRVSSVYLKRKCKIPKKPISVTETIVTVTETPITTAEGTQSKVKESKVKESKGENTKKSKPKKVCLFTKENFKEFYEIYPLHKGPDKALDNWLRLDEKKYNPEKQSPEEIIGLLKKHLEYKMFPLDEPEYIKFPQGWLTDRRWNDELVRPQKKTNSSSHHGQIVGKGGKYDNIKMNVLKPDKKGE